MSYVGTITPQPNDKRDYDIDFAEWFPSGDDITSVVTSVSPAGLTVGYAFNPTVVKLWITGGVDGVTYKVTTRANTGAGRQKEAELKVKVKEV
jgi:hypothetical protein